MGRHVKYASEEMKIEARKRRQMKYYMKNQEEINEKNKERYHKNKISGSLS